LPKIMNWKLPRLTPPSTNSAMQSSESLSSFMWIGR
jgi:hypothetical protein